MNAAPGSRCLRPACASAGVSARGREITGVRVHACLRRVSDTLHASLKSWSASSSAVKPDGTGGVAWVGSASSAPIVPLKWADQVLLRACRGKIEIPSLPPRGSAGGAAEDPVPDEGDTEHAQEGKGQGKVGARRRSAAAHARAVVPAGRRHRRARGAGAGGQGSPVHVPQWERAA